MAKKPSITTISSGYASTTALNDNFEALKEAFDNTLSRDGSTPNTMGADLDMNGNDIVGAGSILVGGVDYLAQSLAYKNAAETAKTAAEAAKVAAELAYDNFDDRYLGAKTSNPSTDNDGNALLDGALYFDTTLNVMKVYDSGNILWKRTTPTTSEQANIDTVTGISSNVTTVAGISTNVTTVADNITDVNSVATNMAEVLTADTNAATATTKAAEASASATAAANSATSASTSATTASNQATAAATSASNAATSESNASTSASNAATSATSASGSASTATTQASNAASSASAASTSETNSANSAAASATSASNAATSESNAATSASNASTSASNAATSASNASTSASDAATSATAAAASYDSFDDRYLGVKTTAPTTDNDGDALTTGCLYYNSTIGQLYIWDGSAWDDAALSASGAVTAFNTRTGSVTLNSTDVANASGLLTTGGTMTGNLSFGDNNKAIFGAGSDLQIYHDGSNSYISEVGDGDLYVRGSNFYITKPNGSLYFSGSNSTGEAGVYFNNSKKLATTSTGIDVTGNLNVSSTGGTTAIVEAPSGYNARVRISSGNAHSSFLEFADTDDSDVGEIVYDHTNNSMRFNTNAGERMRIDSSGNVGIGTSSPSDDLHIASSLATIRLEDSDVAGGASYSLITSSSNGNIAFSADPDNVRSSTDIRFSVDGSERMRIDSSGRVGIGTTSPSYALDIQDDDATRHLRVFRNASGTSAIMVQNADTGSGSNDGLQLSVLNGGDAQIANLENTNLRFLTNSTERMRIDSSGNLLVGVTSSSANMAGLELAANGQLYASTSSSSGHFFNRQSTDGSIVTFRKDGTTVGSIFSSGGVQMGIGDGDTGLLFADNIDAILPWSTSNTQRDNVTDLGRSTTRFKDLYLSGGVLNGSTTSQLYLQGGSSASNGSGILLNGGSHPFTPNTIVFRNGSSETMRIDSSGNLLVGGTSAYGTSTFTVGYGGDIKSSAAGRTAIFNATTSGYNGSLVDFRVADGTVGSIGYESAGTYIDGETNHSGLSFQAPNITPRYNGSITDDTVHLGSSSSRFKDGYFSGTVNAANFNTTSDATLKTNVETLTGSLDAVKAMRGVSFDWIESGNSEVGVIAQEVEAVVPDVVSTNDQGIKSVKYGNLVGVLIEAIKEQQAQIDELKAKLGE